MIIHRSIITECALCSFFVVYVHDSVLDDFESFLCDDDALTMSAALLDALHNSSSSSISCSVPSFISLFASFDDRFDFNAPVSHLINPLRFCLSSDGADDVASASPHALFLVGTC